jgi:hypothetical protein
VNPIADSKEGTPVSAADPAVTGKVPVDRVSDAPDTPEVAQLARIASHWPPLAPGIPQLTQAQAVELLAQHRELQQLRAGWRDIATAPRDERRFRGDLLDVLARVLHYQEHGEPDAMNMTAAQVNAEHERLPDRIVQRFRNEPQFHAHVERALHWVLRVVDVHTRGAR